jgi:hypothetical protein
VATKKVKTLIYFPPPPLSFVAIVKSGIRDPGWIKVGIRDKHPGSATLGSVETTPGAPSRS